MSTRRTCFWLRRRTTGSARIASRATWSTRWCKLANNDVGVPRVATLGLGRDWAVGNHCMTGTATGSVDALRPSAAAALRAWAERVRANRDQVDRFREASPADFYAPVAAMFRADPRRRDEPSLEALRALIHPTDTVLDIGAGGGRVALALALEPHQGVV